MLGVSTLWARAIAWGTAWGSGPLPCCPEARASLQAASPLPGACVVLASGSPLPPAGRAALAILQTGGAVFLRLRREALPRKAVLALSVGGPSLILLHRRSGAGAGGSCWSLTRAVASLPSADCARRSPGQLTSGAQQRGGPAGLASGFQADFPERPYPGGRCCLSDLLVSVLPQKGPSSKHRRWAQVPVCGWSCGFGRGRQGRARVAGAWP